MDRGLRRLAQGDPGAAKQIFVALVHRAPDWPKAHYHVAMACYRLQQFAETERYLRATLELDPTHGGAAHDMGALLINWPDRSVEALMWQVRAVEMEPQNARFHASLGASALFTGDTALARRSLEQAWRLNPADYEALVNLVTLTPMDVESELTARLWAQLTADRAASNLAPADGAKAARALGKALDDVGRHREAFLSFAQSAELMRQAHEYDIGAAEQTLERIEQVFDRKRLASLAGAGAGDPRPIFIVSMPRSGSTLVETILSSHPMVYAGGEHGALLDLLRRSEGRHGEAYPEWGEELTRGDCAKIGAAYLAAAPRGLPGVTRVTDKTPLNFAHLGLIHLCVPNARIIHVRRDPRDVALSCYTAGFVNGQDYGFTRDLGQLGRYWVAYDRLMDHWRQVLPPGTVLDVPYEALVDDPETWARKLIQFCGLDWSPACLDFHNRRRNVTTASAAQVRQPLHKRAVGRWRPYAEALAPAFAAMALAASFNADWPDTSSMAAGVQI